MKQLINRIFLTATLATFSMILAQAQTPATWMVDKSHTSINFTIKHFFSKVTGNFKDFEGKLFLDPKNPSKSNASFSVNINSIDTDNKQRDEHLLNADFFEASKYAKASFKSTKFVQKEKNKYEVHGKLSIKDITKNVVIPVTITGQMEHPMMKGTFILGVAANFSINRNDYGVGTGSWAETKMLSDNVDIDVNMELNSKK